MDFAVTLAEKFGVLPFEVLKQDKDEVIMLINYFIEKGEEIEPETKQAKNHGQVKNGRVRVDDKSATGGWF